MKLFARTHYGVVKASLSGRIARTEESSTVEVEIRRTFLATRSTRSASHCGNGTRTIGGVSDVKRARAGHANSSNANGSRAAGREKRRSVLFSRDVLPKIQPHGERGHRFPRIKSPPFSPRTSRRTRLSLAELALLLLLVRRGCVVARLLLLHA